MKIALFTDTFPPEINGVSVSVGLHRQVLIAGQHEVLVITTNPFGKHTSIEKDLIRIPGVELKKLYGYRMSSFFNAKAYQSVRNWKPDVIHIHTDAGIGIFGKITAFFLKVPTVVTYHTMYEDYTHYAGFLKGLASRVVKRFSKSVAEQCTEFIAPSIKTKERIRSYGVDRFINILPTGIDFSRFEEKNLQVEKIAEIRSRWIQPGEEVVLSLGRIAKEKSMDILIKGFHQYRQHHQRKVRLLMVGDGPERQDLMMLVNQLGLEDSVSFVGAVPIQEVPYYYHVASAFVTASLSETQGLTIMEAMISDCVILCRFDENLSDLVKHQQTGFIFHDASDFSSLLETILTLPKENRLNMKNLSLKALEPYTLSRFFQHLIEVYQRAIRQYW